MFCPLLNIHTSVEADIGRHESTGETIFTNHPFFFSMCLAIICRVKNIFNIQFHVAFTEIKLSIMQTISLIPC